MSIFVFFAASNINIKNFSKTKNKIFIKNSKNNSLLPPKPKEKWKYIQTLKNL